MATAPQPQPKPPQSPPPSPPPPPKPEHDDKHVARRRESKEGEPPIEEGTDTATPYPDEHYDTPNPYSPETIADEQRKRSDAMAHAPDTGQHETPDQKRLREDKPVVGKK